MAESGCSGSTPIKTTMTDPLTVAECIRGITQIGDMLVDRMEIKIGTGVQMNDNDYIEYGQLKFPVAYYVLAPKQSIPGVRHYVPREPQRRKLRALLKLFYHRWNCALGKMTQFVHPIRDTATNNIQWFDGVGPGRALQLRGSVSKGRQLVAAKDLAAGTAIPFYGVSGVAKTPDAADQHYLDYRITASVHQHFDIRWDESVPVEEREFGRDWSCNNCGATNPWYKPTDECRQCKEHGGWGAWVDDTLHRIVSCSPWKEGAVAYPDAFIGARANEPTMSPIHLLEYAIQVFDDVGRETLEECVNKELSREEWDKHNRDATKWLAREADLVRYEADFLARCRWWLDNGAFGQGHQFKLFNDIYHALRDAETMSMLPLSVRSLGDRMISDGTDRTLWFLNTLARARWGPATATIDKKTIQQWRRKSFGGWLKRPEPSDKIRWLVSRYVSSHRVCERRGQTLRMVPVDSWPREGYKMKTEDEPAVYLDGPRKIEQEWWVSRALAGDRCMVGHPVVQRLYRNKTGEKKHDFVYVGGRFAVCHESDKRESNELFRPIKNKSDKNFIVITTRRKLPVAISEEEALERGFEPKRSCNNCGATIHTETCRREECRQKNAAVGYVDGYLVSGRPRRVEVPRGKSVEVGSKLPIGSIIFGNAEETVRRWRPNAVFVANNAILQGVHEQGVRALLAFLGARPNQQFTLSSCFQDGARRDPCVFLVLNEDVREGEAIEVCYGYGNLQERKDDAVATAGAQQRSCPDKLKKHQPPLWLPSYSCFSGERAWMFSASENVSANYRYANWKQDVVKKQHTVQGEVAPLRLGAQARMMRVVTANDPAFRSENRGSPGQYVRWREAEAEAAARFGNHGGAAALLALPAEYEQAVFGLFLQEGVSSLRADDVRRRIVEKDPCPEAHLRYGETPVDGWVPEQHEWAVLYDELHLVVARCADQQVTVYDPRARPCRRTQTHDVETKNVRYDPKKNRDVHAGCRWCQEQAHANQRYEEMATVLWPDTSFLGVVEVGCQVENDCGLWVWMLQRLGTGFVDTCNAVFDDTFNVQHVGLLADLVYAEFWAGRHVRVSYKRDDDSKLIIVLAYDDGTTRREVTMATVETIRRHLLETHLGGFRVMRSAVGVRRFVHGTGWDRVPTEEKRKGDMDFSEFPHLDLNALKQIGTITSYWTKWSDEDWAFLLDSVRAWYPPVQSVDLRLLEDDRIFTTLENTETARALVRLATDGFLWHAAVGPKAAAVLRDHVCLLDVTGTPKTVREELFLAPLVQFVELDPPDNAKSIELYQRGEAPLTFRAYISGRSPYATHGRTVGMPPKRGREGVKMLTEERYVIDLDTWGEVQAHFSRPSFQPVVTQGGRPRGFAPRRRRGEYDFVLEYDFVPWVESTVVAGAYDRYDRNPFGVDQMLQNQFVRKVFQGAVHPPLV